VANLSFNAMNVQTNLNHSKLSPMSNKNMDRIVLFFNIDVIIYILKLS
jgi:hypothetical protein